MARDAAALVRSAERHRAAGMRRRDRRTGPGDPGEELSVYGLSDEDLAIQARAAAFADELIPLEVEAEHDNGEPAPGRRRRAREAGP